MKLISKLPKIKRKFTKEKGNLGPTSKMKNSPTSLISPYKMQ